MTNDLTGNEAHAATCRGPNETPETEAALAAFQRYWQTMRQGASVPRRSDIDPRGIEPLLANAFIVERIAPGLARLRIAGSHLTDLMGMEVRGMPISAFLEPDSRDALALHLVRLFDQPAALRLALKSAARPSAPELRGTLIMLPLRSDLGDISRALGCLVSTGGIGRGPRRFEIADASVRPLNDVPPEGVAVQLGARLDIAEGSTPAPVRALRGSERPYLRLIKS